MTERGLDHAVACVEATKKVRGDQIGLAFDYGPGWTPKDAIRFARAVEPYHLAWLEDLITGDYEPYPNAQVFKQVKDSTTTPIHTGEEIYLRENFKDLIETQAVDVLGPDPEDLGGIAELKWIAEYADFPRHPGRSARELATDSSALPRKCIWGPACRRTTSPSNMRRASRIGDTT
jgi:L-alanine-DL-glutamate epimerase-like enolase superfamily enzyme